MNIAKLTSWYHMMLGPVIDEQQTEMLQVWLMQQLNGHEGADKFRLTLVLTAREGTYPACIAMYDFLRSLRDIELHVVSQGVVANAVALIPLAAEPERRWAMPNTVFQVRFPSITGANGQFSLDKQRPQDDEEYLERQAAHAKEQMVDGLPLLYRLRDTAVHIFAARLNACSEADVRDFLHDGEVFGLDGALKCGLASAEVQEYEQEPSKPPTAAENMRAGYL